MPRFFDTNAFKSFMTMVYITAFLRKIESGPGEKQRLHITVHQRHTITVILTFPN